MFIYDYCEYSLAVGTLVKYEFDTFSAKSEMVVIENLMNKDSSVTPHHGVDVIVLAGDLLSCLWHC